MTGPKVSVVTVNHNMAATLGRTMESVLGQDYPDFELIVVDGASTDGSRNIIASYSGRLAYWVSEPDRNLYDAMNKGVAEAKGEWVLFMNAGDCFATPNVLSEVFGQDHVDSDMVYGHHIRCYPGRQIERLVLAERPSVLPRRMPCSHQALFTRRSLLIEHAFEIGLLAADYEFMLAAYAGGRRFKQVDCVVALTEMEGRSDLERSKMLRQRCVILRRHGFWNFGLAVYYFGLLARARLACVAKQILPRPVTNWILRHRRISGLG